MVRYDNEPVQQNTALRFYDDGFVEYDFPSLGTWAWRYTTSATAVQWTFSGSTDFEFLNGQVVIAKLLRDSLFVTYLNSPYYKDEVYVRMRSTPAWPPVSLRRAEIMRNMADGCLTQLPVCNVKAAQ